MKHLFTRDFSMDYTLKLKVLYLMFVLVLTEEQLPRIQTCQNRLNGQACFLNCTVKDFHDTVIFFHPPGSPVVVCLKGENCTSRFNYYLEKVKEKRQVVLKIPALNKSLHEGSWICTYGALSSPANTLKIYESGTDTRNTLYVSAEDGEDVTLKCDIDVHSQSHSIVWYFGNKTLKMGTKYNIGAQGKLSLTINDITKADKGFYHCSVVIPSGSNNTKNGSLINVVSVKKKVLGIAEIGKNTRHTIPVSAEEGENVTLMCDVDVGDQNYTVTWYYETKPLKTGRKYNTGSKGKLSLKINDITKADKGLYHCSVAIPSGSNNTKNGSLINVVSVMTKSFGITDLSKLQKVPISYIQVLEGNSITVLCDINPKNRPHNVTWYLNEEKIVLGGKYQRGVFGDSTLIIHHFMSDDNGVYRCLMKISTGTSIIIYDSLVSVTAMQDQQKEQHQVTNIILLVTIMLLQSIVLVILGYARVYRKVRKRWKLSSKGHQARDDEINESVCQPSDGISRMIYPSSEDIPRFSSQPLGGINREIFCRSSDNFDEDEYAANISLDGRQKIVCQPSDEINRMKIYQSSDGIPRFLRQPSDGINRNMFRSSDTSDEDEWVANISLETRSRGRHDTTFKKNRKFQI